MFWYYTSDSVICFYYNFQEDFDDNFENTGVTALALYDYQAAADDEISFDPNDIITNIEMVSVSIKSNCLSFGKM